MEFFEKIFNTPSVAEYTQKMVCVLKEELSQLFDEYSENVLGGVSFTKKVSNDGFHLMLACAIDTQGLVVTYVDKSKVSINSLGAFNAQSLAFSDVCFEDSTKGVLVPCNQGELPDAITSYEVETFDDDVQDKIKLGDVAYFDEKITYKNGYYTGFGAGAKMCMCFAVQLSKKLLSEKTLLEDLGIGKLSVAFLGQSALGNRGASVEAYNICPDRVINISTADMSEKNVGKIDFSDGVYVKMSDAGSVSDEDSTLLCEKILDTFGISHKRRVSNKERSALSRLTLSKQGSKGAEIDLCVKYISTRGETVKNPFETT